VHYAINIFIVGDLFVSGLGLRFGDMSGSNITGGLSFEKNLGWTSASFFFHRFLCSLLRL
jgi:hypothetical protein